MVAKLTLQEGAVFNSWTVMRQGDNTKTGQARYWCKCVCGVEGLIVGSKLPRNETKSCRSCAGKSQSNLQHLKLMSQMKTTETHGMADTRIYKIYHNLRSRCNNTSLPNFKDYGGRGIRCEWDTFEQFYADMRVGYTDELTIERVDVDGNYNKANCVWADRVAQSNNKRNNHYITYNGRRQSLMKWCNELDIPYERTKRRIYRGCSIEVAFDSRSMTTSGKFKEI